MPTTFNEIYDTWIKSSITAQADIINCCTTSTGPIVTSSALNNTIASVPILTENTEKLERHVDQLEEDIAFLNEWREEYKKEIEALKIMVNNLQLELRSIGTRLDELEGRENNVYF